MWKGHFSQYYYYLDIPKLQRLFYRPVTSRPVPSDRPRKMYSVSLMAQGCLLAVHLVTTHSEGLRVLFYISDFKKKELSPVQCNKLLRRKNWCVRRLRNWTECWQALGGKCWWASCGFNRGASIIRSERTMDRRSRRYNYSQQSAVWTRVRAVRNLKTFFFFKSDPSHRNLFLRRFIWPCHPGL